MRKLVTSGIFAAAAAAGAIAVSAPPAFAVTWTVDNTNANGSYAAHSSSIVFNNVNTGAQFTCSTADASGVAPSGPHPDGLGIATIATATFGASGSLCAGPFGSMGTATKTTGSGDWLIDAESPDPASPGTSNARIRNIDATLTLTSFFGTCTARVTGTVNNVTYSNVGTGRLAVTPDPSPQQLTVATATGAGCANLINAGDSTTFQATYNIANPAAPGHLFISSP